MELIRLVPMPLITEQIWPDGNRSTHYSETIGKNGLYALGSLQSGSKGRDMRILTSYLSQAGSSNQPICRCRYTRDCRAI